MKIEKVPLGQLTPDPDNAKEHTPKQIAQIKASIERFGNNDPIAVWGKDNLIVEGHGRYEALKALGYKEAEVIRLDRLTDEERRAYALAHNQLTMNTGWLDGILEKNLDAIESIDMADFGFSGAAEWFGTGDKGEAREGEEEYAEFLEKFEDEHTTDDCYTPEKVYDAVAEWVAKEYGLKKKDFVRPFYPGGDYQKENYKQNSVVVDNPPFSILSQIIKWYAENGVRFFLFAPALTCFNGGADACATCLCVGVTITYANGAIVNTSFITNLEPAETRARTVPELYMAVKKANDETRAETKKEIPSYSYPDHVATAAMLNRYSKYAVDFIIPRAESVKIDALDAQKDAGNAIFGDGYLLSERAAAERAAATRWELSQREREIIASLK